MTLQTKNSPSPLVSVVLGTYNGAVYLEEQLRSLLAQTYTNLEIIAVDDRSTDRTVEILNVYAAKDSRIKVFVNETNLGFIRNFENGGRISSGEYIAYCDQDDYWMPDKVETLVNAIGDHPMAYCNSMLCDQDMQPLGKKISDLVYNQSYYDARQLCIFPRVYGHASLVSRSLFEKSIPFGRCIPHDGWLAYHATLHGGVIYVDEVLVKYRQHANNAFGVIGIKRKKDRAARAEKKKKELTNIRTRMEDFYNACPASLAPQKRLLRALVASYRNFYPWNDVYRMLLFFGNYKFLLAPKIYSTPRKLLFCLKMLIKIK